MPVLKNIPERRGYQNYVAELEVKRGFAHQTSIYKCLFPGKEVGELFKAIRNSEGLSPDNRSSFKNVGDEPTDIYIYLFALANQKNIDLNAASWTKEEINKNQTWKSEING